MKDLTLNKKGVERLEFRLNAVNKDMERRMRMSIASGSSGGSSNDLVARARGLHIYLFLLFFVIFFLVCVYFFSFKHCFVFY